MSVISFTQGGLALASGALSILSPCVLPVLPIVISSALNAHRLGALALGAGLIISFTGMGMLLATVGVSLGLSEGLVRYFAGSLMVLVGLTLLIPALQARFVLAASALSGKGNALLNKVSGDSWHGQFVMGLLLGLVWSPCVGPTLGAAVALASEGKQLSQAALVMLLFGVGAAIPLIVIGSLSRVALGRFRGSLHRVASRGKVLLGALLMLIGAGLLTGYDHAAEAWLLKQSPAWLTDLTTRL